MRVIFTGHTGVEKREALSQLALAAAARLGVPENLDDVNTRRSVRVYCLEDYIHRRTGGLRAFLEAKDSDWQADQWRRGLADLRSDLDSQPAELELIALHCTLQRSGVVTCPVDIRALEALGPSQFVTLIDDIYEVWRRIEQRDSEHETNFRLRLKEVATWRSVEILATDLICKALSGDGSELTNLVLAVKHPAASADRLVLQPSMKRVYAACSITAPRETEEGRAEVDAYRDEMQRRYAAFDPLTIDERLLGLFNRARDAQQDGEDRVDLLTGDRWSVDTSKSLVQREQDLYPIRLPVDEILEVETEIGRQIEVRDYRLIRQADAMAAYRPIFEKKPSMGVFSELKYARDGAHKPTHIFSPPEDGIDASPFATEQIQHEELDSFYRALEAELE